MDMLGTCILHKKLGIGYSKKYFEVSVHHSMRNSYHSMRNACDPCNY